MEIAINITNKIKDKFISDFNKSGFELKTDQAKAWILENLKLIASELIGQKAVDQVHRMLVIEDLKKKNPKPPLSKEDQEFKDLTRALHKARNSKDWRVRGNEKPQNPKVRRSTRW